MSYLSDEFDYCGRPSVLYATLRGGEACPHTQRMVGLAAGLIADGARGDEASRALSEYERSFSARRGKFPVDQRTCRGPENAAVTVVEFSDFECPFCNRARPIFEEFAKVRKDVRVCWLPYPLTQHPNAIPAGQAALFARDNGKFWEIHDALFENQSSLSAATIKRLLQRNGLDVKAYDKAVAARKYLDELDASRAAASAAGIDSTPSVFINGRKLTLPISVEVLSASTDDELERLANNGTWSGATADKAKK